MLLAFLTIFVIYISFRIGIDIYESFYIKKEAAKDAVLMEKKEYLEAGLYAVYKKIIDIFDALASLFIVVIILSGGLWLINYLDNNNSLITIFAYFALVYIVSLPIMIYSKIIDKRFGFNISNLKSDYRVEHFQELELTRNCLVNLKSKVTYANAFLRL